MRQHTPRLLQGAHAQRGADDAPAGNELSNRGQEDHIAFRQARDFRGQPVRNPDGGARKRGPEGAQQPALAREIVRSDPDGDQRLGGVRVREVVGPIRGRSVPGTEKDVAERIVVGDVDVGTLQPVRLPRGVELHRGACHRRRVEREERRTVARAQVSPVRQGQRIDPLGGGDQLELGAIRKLDVLVADAVVVRHAGLEREPELPVASSGRLQVVDGDRDVVEPGDGRVGKTCFTRDPHKRRCRSTGDHHRDDKCHRR